MGMVGGRQKRTRFTCQQIFFVRDRTKFGSSDANSGKITARRDPMENRNTMKLMRINYIFCANGNFNVCTWCLFTKPPHHAYAMVTISEYTINCGVAPTIVVAIII